MENDHKQMIEEFDPEVPTKVKDGNRKNTIMWLIIIILGVVLVIVIIGLAAGLGVEISRTENICTTPACVELSSQLLANLNQSVDPCDDFYHFACQGFIEDAILPFGSDSVGTFETPRSINVERIRTLMESGDNRGLESIDKAFTYYQSCLEGDTLEMSVKSLKDILQNRLGGWPLIGIDLGSSWSLDSQEGYLLEQLYGSGAFFSIAVIPDPQNTSRNIFNVDQSGLTVPFPVYEDDFAITFIKKTMLDVLKLVNPAVDNATYIQAIDDIVEFEMAIANFYDFDPDSTSLFDRIVPMSYDNISSIMPQFNWSSAIQLYGDLANITIDQTVPLNVFAPNFLRSMSALVENTATSTLENYAKWHMLFNLLPSMSTEFSTIYNDFNGISTATPHYKNCVNNVEAELPLAVARAFTEEYLPPGAQKNLTLLLRELESALRERINTRDWLDEPTRQRALDKLKHVKEQVAYPDEILDNAFLDGYYSSLTVSSEVSYFINDFNSKIFNRLRAVANTDMGVANNRSTWILHQSSAPTTDNAEYFFLLNQIYIYEGILETPFFRTSWPYYLKFAAIGMVAAHEYIHGFDDGGRIFNEVGVLENWWTDASQNQFNSRAQCFIDQYSSFSLPVGPVDGVVTLSENIADNGGLRVAIMAYKEYLQKTGLVEPMLPGLSYNTEQLFFIGNAQLNCLAATEEAQEQLLGGVHSPNPIRVMGPLSNSPEFAAAFNCPVGSRMNPEDKCELW